jgi:hypothetical protein
MFFIEYASKNQLQKVEKIIEQYKIDGSGNSKNQLTRLIMNPEKSGDNITNEHMKRSELKQIITEGDWTKANTFLHKNTDKKSFIGEPIFVDNEKIYEESMKKIDNELAKVEGYGERRDKEDLDWLKSQKKQTKYAIEAVKGSKSVRDFAIKVLHEAAEFHKKYNDLYMKVKDDLTSKDHIKIANAINKLQLIYPRQLILDGGKLKSTGHADDDNEFIQHTIGWINAIKNRYNTLVKRSVWLGKTSNQRQGYNKLSQGMKMRWMEDVKSLKLKDIISELQYEASKDLESNTDGVYMPKDQMLNKFAKDYIDYVDPGTARIFDFNDNTFRFEFNINLPKDKVAFTSLDEAYKEIKKDLTFKDESSYSKVEALDEDKTNYVIKVTVKGSL